MQRHHHRDILQRRSWGASLLRLRRRQFQWTVVVLDDVQLDVIDDFFDHPLPGRAPIFGPSAKHETLTVRFKRFVTCTIRKMMTKQFKEFEC
jgi:hypothetical protein